MGGSALKLYTTTRLDASEYFVYVADFANVFHDMFGFKPVLIDAYKSKESFGDADFLVQSDLLPPNWIDILKSHLGLSSTQYIKNGNVVSIGWGHFQIDLIVTQPEHMKASEFYFAYNDLQNLNGRICHKLGIKLSHKGISIIIRHKSASDHILGEVFLTHNAKEILDILGLSVEQFDAGFDTLEDIFKFVASSKYFDPGIYAFENRNATSRVRDKKRPTYNKFLKWIEDTKPTPNYVFENKSELGGYSIRMPYYETEVLTRYPHVKAEVDAIIKKFEQHQEFKKIFNGIIVAELTGLGGMELGRFMSKVLEKMDSDKSIYINNPELVRQLIIETFEEK